MACAVGQAAKAEPAKAAPREVGRHLAQKQSASAFGCQVDFLPDTAWWHVLLGGVRSDCISSTCTCAKGFTDSRVLEFQVLHYLVTLA